MLLHACTLMLCAKQPKRCRVSKFDHETYKGNSENIQSRPQEWPCPGVLSFTCLCPLAFQQLETQSILAFVEKWVDIPNGSLNGEMMLFFKTHLLAMVPTWHMFPSGTCDKNRKNEKTNTAKFHPIPRNCVWVRFSTNQIVWSFMNTKKQQDKSFHLNTFTSSHEHHAAAEILYIWIRLRGY